MRYSDGFWPNLAGLTYSVLGWAAGVALLFTVNPVLNAAGVLLTAHALVVSAYFIHECAHGAVFTSARLNDAAGVAMTWINGACYSRFERLKLKHLRHHADRADIVTFDYRAWLSRRPLATRLIVSLEWCHLPAIEFLMRGSVIAAPFGGNGSLRSRARILAIACVRISLFGALAVVSPRALLLYAIAYLLFVHVLRFLDAFQHTYEVIELPPSGKVRTDPRRSRDYEHANTYSNLMTSSPLANLLVLNFAFHNAHHARPAVPWYRLRRLHDELYGSSDAQVLPFGGLLRSYHRNRVSRVLDPDYGEVQPQAPRVDSFVGAVGVSFLTAI